jgi:hypothetical protein
MNAAEFQQTLTQFRPDSLSATFLSALTPETVRARIELIEEALPALVQAAAAFVPADGAPIPEPLLRFWGWNRNGAHRSEEEVRLRLRTIGPERAAEMAARTLHAEVLTAAARWAPAIDGPLLVQLLTTDALGTSGALQERLTRMAARSGPWLRGTLPDSLSDAALHAQQHFVSRLTSATDVDDIVRTGNALAALAGITGLSRPTRSMLLRLIEPLPAEGLETPPDGEPILPLPDHERAFAIARALIADRTLLPTDLAQLAPWATGLREGELAYEAAQHPRATAVVWQALLHSAPSLWEMAFVGVNPGAWEHPAILEQLVKLVPQADEGAETPIIAIRHFLCHGCPPSMFWTWFPEILEHAPALALSLLLYKRPDQIPWLPDEMLDRLLESAQVRIDLLLEEAPDDPLSESERRQRTENLEQIPGRALVHRIVARWRGSRPLAVATMPEGAASVRPIDEATAALCLMADPDAHKRIH